MSFGPLAGTADGKSPLPTLADTSADVVTVVDGNAAAHQHPRNGGAHERRVVAGVDPPVVDDGHLRQLETRQGTRGAERSSGGTTRAAWPTTRGRAW
jgi:hypothetical protein